jgi:hypothetical protein
MHTSVREMYEHAKGLRKNNFTFWHPGFRPSSADLHSRQILVGLASKEPAIPEVSLNQIGQT